MKFSLVSDTSTTLWWRPDYMVDFRLDCDSAGAMVMAAEAAKTKNGKVDWRTVRGLMVDAIYGGRVDNPHDMRVLATYLRRYFNSDVVRAPSCFGKRWKREHVLFVHVVRGLSRESRSKINSTHGRTYYR